MLPPLALADDLASDPRLAAPLTVGERYLPLSDFAKRLSAVTKETITTDPQMTERKLALYVDGRPAAETMARVADALGARWTAQAGGWRLTPDPAVDALERKAPALREAARRKAVADWVVRSVEHPGSANDTFQQTTTALLRDVGAGAATAALLAGMPLIATGDGRAGTRQIPMDETFAGMRIRQPDGSMTSPTNGIIVMRFEPETGRIVTSVRSLGPNGSGGTSSWADPLHESKPEPTALERLDEGWAASGEPSVAAAGLKSVPAGSDPYGAGLASLADVLERIHARSDLPVAAESFRAPVAPWGDRGDTVGEALRAALDGPMVRSGGVPRFAWKGAGGWLLVRTPGAWALRRGEIPERRLVPLEAKRTPTLDDYAALAGSLTEAQRVALSFFRPLATFPTIALRRGYWGLLVYDALSPELRRRAIEGIPFAELPASAQARWRRTIADQENGFFLPERWTDAVLRDRLPPDAGFQAVPDGFTSVYGYELSPGPGTSPTGVRYRAALFRFGAGEATPSFDAPLSPKAP